MRTKLLLPLVTLAMLATALPASAQGPLETEAIVVLEQPFLYQEGTYTGIGWEGWLEIPGSGDVAGTYAFSMVPVETPEEHQPSDIPPRGVRRL